MGQAGHSSGNANSKLAGNMEDAPAERMQLAGL